MVREGWSGADDIFLDLDPDHGLVAGERWAKALEDAATRCEAVLFLVSEGWLASKWCGDEYQLANKFNKKLFALLIDDVALDRLPGGMSAQWQAVRLQSEPAERFLTVPPRTQQQSPVALAAAANRGGGWLVHLAGAPPPAARPWGAAGGLRGPEASVGAGRRAGGAPRATAVSAPGPVPRSGRGAVRARCRSGERQASAARTRRDGRRRGAAAGHDPLGLLWNHAERKDARRHRPAAAQPGPGAAWRDRARDPRAERGAAPQGRPGVAGPRRCRRRAPASRDRGRNRRAPAPCLRA